MYVLLQNHCPPYDSVDYAYAVRTGVGLFHPHHLLYNFCGRGLFVFVSRFDNVDAIRLLAWANALVTAALAWIVCLVLFEHTGRRLPALVGALLCAFSNGIWHMATSVEVYPVMLLCQVATLYLLVRTDEPSLATVIGAGLLTGLGMLFHQTGIFFVLVAAYVLWRQRAPLFRIAAYGVVAGVTCGVPYLLAAGSEGIRTPRGFLDWLLAYTHSAQYASGQWGGGYRLKSLPLDLQGFTESWIRPERLYDLFYPGRGGPTVWDLLSAIPLVGFVGLLVYLLVSVHKRAAAPRSIFRAALLVWVALYGAFTFWWEPRSFEFWLLIAPPLSMLFGLAIDRLDLTQRRYRLASVLLIAALFLGNLFTAIGPAAQPSRNYVAAVTHELGAAQIADGDVVLSDESAFAPYARYYLGKSIEVRSLAQYRAVADGLAGTRQIFLLEADLVESADEQQRSYAGDVASATVIGDYETRGRRWKIWRLTRAPRQ